MRKGDHVRLLSAKLEKSMVSLFQGSTDLPRLVLENMDSSQIQAQPNCSPELAMYLDMADRNFDASANIRVGPECNYLGILSISPWVTKMQIPTTRTRRGLLLNG
jgi:hypothetical protein